MILLDHHHHHFFIFWNSIQCGMPWHPPPLTHLNRLTQNHRHAGAAPGNIDLNRRRRHAEQRPKERGAPGTDGPSRHMAIHAPPGTRPGTGAVPPFGVEAFEGAAEEEVVVLIDLEIGAATEANGVGGDVGDLSSVAVDTVAAEEEGGVVRGGDRGGVDDEGYAGVAARVTEREVVRELVDDARRDSDIKEPNFEARGVS